LLGTGGINLKPSVEEEKGGVQDAIKSLTPRKVVPKRGKKQRRPKLGVEGEGWGPHKLLQTMLGLGGGAKKEIRRMGREELWQERF